MKKFIRDLKRFINENNLISPRDKVIVGFSGGPDSMALIYALWKISSDIGFYIIAAHVNYNLRGEDSKNDEKFVRKLCASLNIPLLVKQAKIEDKASLEAKAREIRFGFFKEIYRLYNAHSIALGHNANDQAETILLNLFRGSGTNGLKGILPKNQEIIHPLIEFTRNDILEFLETEKLEYRIDKSNFENVFTRNRLRNVFIPYVLENINPRFTEKIINTARVLRESEEIIASVASKTMSRLLLEKDDKKVVISLKKLLKQLPVLRFYYYKKIHKLLSGTDRDFFQYHFEEIEKLIKSDGSKLKSFPSNITVIKEYDKLTFQKTSTIEKPDLTHQRKIDKIRARLKFENYRLYFKKLKKVDDKLLKERNVVFLDLDKIKLPLIFRHRKNGDKFIPIGHSHPKKLKEFLIDKKISKFERDKLLIIQDNEKILYIVGLSLDERVRVNNETNNFLMIRWEKIKYPKKRMAERFKRLLY